MEERLTHVIKENQKNVNFCDSKQSFDSWIIKCSRWLGAVVQSRQTCSLEWLEFDPEEFCHLWEAAKGQANILQGIKNAIPQYIIHKLGLNRDPIAKLHQEINESSISCDYDHSNTSLDGGTVDSSRLNNSSMLLLSTTFMEDSKTSSTSSNLDNSSTSMPNTLTVYS